LNKRTLTTIAIFAVLLMSTGIPSAHGYVRTIYAKFSTSTPVLDGTIDAAEWEDATVYRGVGDEGIFDVCLMQDRNYLYIGVKAISFASFTGDEVQVYFDEGNDGGHGSGSGDGILTNEQEDMKAIDGDGVFIDGYWSSSFVSGVGWYDSKLGYGVDMGVAAIGWHTDHWEAEFKIPFHGVEGVGYPKDLSDLNIDVSDFVGLAIAIDSPSYSPTFIRVFPEGADLTNPHTWAELRFDNDPPTISDVGYSPQDPKPSDQVTVTAKVDDDVSGLKAVQLWYSTDGGGSWDVVDMSASGMTFTATIPEKPEGTTIQFKVKAEDYAGFRAESAVASYTVTAAPAAPGIPGFPLEAVMIGVLLAAIALMITRKRPSKHPHTPTHSTLTTLSHYPLFFIFVARDNP